MAAMAFRVEPFSREYAAAAAEIHAQGQPGTFLTRLGPAFLRALYAQMGNSPACVGFVALAEDDKVLGVTVGTTDSGRLFRELIRTRGFALAPAVCLALVRDPALLRHVFETLRHPNTEGALQGEAELLFIGVRPKARRQGLGRALFESLAAELKRRGLEQMGLVVDDANLDAQSFYQEHGMQPARSLTMYGRTMRWYQLSLASWRQSVGQSGELWPVEQRQHG